jgi:enoyl-CoA hydratase/carnithine racemase
MPFEVLTYNVTDAVCTITINRPEARNAISPQVVRELRAAFRQADEDSGAHVIVLTGAGDKAFCAGGDLGGGGGGMGYLDRYQINRQFAELFKEMASLGKPVVAAVNGHALAGGFGLMLACDLVVARDDADFGTPEINIGLFPYVIMATIQRHLGRKRTLDLLLTGRKMKAKEALEWGLLNRTASKEEFGQAVQETVAMLKSKSPMILALGRRAFYAMEDLDLNHAVDYLNSMLTINMLSEDSMEGIMAFFQKRPPEWKGK